VAEHLPHHPMVEGQPLMLALGEKKDSDCFVIGGNRMVEHSPHHPKVKDLSSATYARTGKYENGKMLKKND